MRRPCLISNEVSSRSDTFCCCAVVLHTVEPCSELTPADNVQIVDKSLLDCMFCADDDVQESCISQMIAEVQPTHSSCYQPEQSLLAVFSSAQTWRCCPICDEAESRNGGEKAGLGRV